MNDESGERTEAASIEIDPSILEAAVERLKSRQSLGKAVVAGGLAAAAGAALWAVLTVLTGYQIGFMAVGVGFLVGFAVRTAGRGVTPSFQIVGAAFALVGCLLGNLFAVVGMISKIQEIPLGELLSELTPAIALEMMKASFNPMDLLFYAIAVYEGWKLSRYELTEGDLEAGRGNVPIEP